MAKGFGLATQVNAENAAKGGGNSLWGGKLAFKLPESGDKAVVRFIPNQVDVYEDEDGDEVEENVYAISARHHQVPVDGRSWPEPVPCIAQDEDGNPTNDDCPGCDRDLDLKFKGYILMIWRDAPVFKTDEKGYKVKDNNGDFIVVGQKDQIAIWSSGPRLFDELGETDDTYGDLGNRDFRIKRKGSGTDTTYVISPVDPDGGKQPMSKEDKKLVKDNEINLNAFIKPPSYDEFEARLNGTFTGSKEKDDSPVAQSRATNPFKNKKKKSS